MNTDEHEVAGRTDVQHRVLTGIARAAAADLLGVAADRVRASVSGSGSGLAVHVRSPLAIPSLLDASAVAAATPVVARLEEAQGALHERLTALWGREVSRVDLTVTGAELAERRRVR